ncbi:MAG: hypothetical protein K2H18_08625, partial [Muribaculaceae bacterium]|nr:hypothetical protein [Muribaculaceae bacterium]
MKTTLLSLTILSIPSLFAAASEGPTTVWANLLIGKPGQDQATSIVSSGSNEIYWMLTDGSTTDDKDVTYAGTILYEGASYDGNSANKNLTLLKTNAAGEKQWCVYSAWGDFVANDGGLAVSPEGNIIFAGTVRHTDGYLDHPVTIVDATGKSTEIDWSVERRWNRMIVGEVSSEGELKWVKTYDVDNSPVPAASGANAEFTANALTTSGVCVDNEGNIFVCGNFRTDFTFPKADGTSVILHPRNVTGWSGDSQAAVGSLFLVKLDKAGYYLSHLEESGED